MDIKELNKKQLILVTLLITFIVSIATGIVTVSLMQKMPKSVPKTINNVIQRTIEKVTTVQVPTPVKDTPANNSNDKPKSMFIGDGNVLVSIYASGSKVVPSTPETPPTDTANTTPIDTSTTDIVTDTANTTPIDTSTTDTSTDTISTTPTDTSTINTTTSLDSAKVSTPKKDAALGKGIIISDVGLILVDSKILAGYDSFKVTLDGIDFDLSILKKFGNGFTVLKINSKQDVGNNKKTDTTNISASAGDAKVKKIDTTNTKVDKP